MTKRTTKTKPAAKREQDTVEETPAKNTEADDIKDKTDELLDDIDDLLDDVAEQFGSVEEFVNGYKQKGGE